MNRCSDPDKTTETQTCTHTGKTTMSCSGLAGSTKTKLKKHLQTKN